MVRFISSSLLSEEMKKVGLLSSSDVGSGSGEDDGDDMGAMSFKFSICENGMIWGSKREKD